ncbi:ABC transporter permease [Oceanobacillus alkalisoli]|uniref:ABC transporter permease n=1 Tax=Oceanobacillus alkalisoli TaxID=2925113 RepID=UPI001F11F7BC|nr:ABC transporter permease [Oceanobacillus alkalisoli]MCF3941985.1 ABC transporter permease [Oceanobacillus alkalisoli]
MIFQMIKKQYLQFLRNPVEIVLLIGLPIILITILGNALGNLIDGGEIDLTFKLAIIEHEDEEIQVENFLTELENGDLPDEIIAAFAAVTDSLAPVEMFKEVLRSEELNDMIIVEEAHAREMDAIKADDSYAAILEFPENFSADLLENILLDEKMNPEAIIHYKAGSEIAGNIVEQIVAMYQEEFTLGTFLGNNGIDPQQLQQKGAEITQEVSSVSPHEPLSAKAYYTIGMIVMNVLFMATTIAQYAFRERQSHIFNRMIIADFSRWVYFIGILLTALIFAWIQAILVFIFAYFAFDVTWPDLTAFLVITFFFTLAVGGLAVLLTAISFRSNSEQIISFFSGVVVTIFAFLGGSFFPSGTGSFLGKLGDYTPNGAAMSAYLSILRGESITDNADHLIFIACFAIGAIIIGVISYPKRGAAS